MRLRDFVVASLAVVSAMAVRDAGAEALWRLVAQSHMVVVGAPVVPVRDILKAQRADDHRYVDISVPVIQCIKGDVCAGTVVIRHYTKPIPFKPRPQALIELNAKQSIFFLVQIDEKYSKEVRFAGNTHEALRPHSDAVARRILSAVKSQERLLAEFPAKFRPEQDPLYHKVAALVEATLQRDTQENAFRQLAALSQAGVPAMIMLMDDRRPLPVKRISLVKRSPGSFEGVRHYRPEVVVDALAIILNQLTGETFGQIENGASERQRKAEIEGWRVYLSRRALGAP
jgi:hypothetical protein